MGLADKVVISAALTGVAANREQSKWIPYTPQEIAEEAVHGRARQIIFQQRINDFSMWPDRPLTIR